MPKLGFFWGDSWTARGMSFTREHRTKNLHWQELVFAFGATWRIRLMWFKHAWYRLLWEGWLND